MTTWAHSMNGVPWTAKKMRQAVSTLREGASVTFAFGADPLERLLELDEKVLALRPDLQLHAWSVAAARRLSHEEATALASLAHVRHLRLSGLKGAPFDVLAGLKRLESLSIAATCRVDLSFVAQMSSLRHVELSAMLEHLEALARCKRLKTLALSGAIGDLAPLAGCTRLESLRFGASTIRSVAFVAELRRLSRLDVDAATVACALAPLVEVPRLAQLSLTNNRDLLDVAFVGGLVRLERLRIDQPRVVRLPDLSKLRRLSDVQLCLKAWTNPEVLETLPRVRSIALSEINPKLKAERFYFLATSPELRALERVDVRFIDFGKRRRAAIEAHFEAAGKKALLVSEP